MVFWLPPCRFDRRRVDPEPCLGVPISVVGFNAFWAETGRPFGSAKLGREGPDAVDADPIALALVWGRGSGWRSSVASVVAGQPIVVDAKPLPFVIAPAVLLLFPLAASP